MNWPESLVQLIADRSCVVFVGAGFSRNARSTTGSSKPPGWADLLTSLVEVVHPKIGKRRTHRRLHIDGLIAAGDLLTAAEAIHLDFTEKGMEPEFRSKIALSVDGPTGQEWQPGRCHELLAEINPRVIVTTNYDEILERQMQNGYKIVRQTDNHLGTHLRNNTDIILKLHGTADVRDDMILTRTDFTRLYRSASDVLDCLAALIATRTFIFLGYSVGDPDLQLLLESEFGIKNKTPGHYVLLNAQSSSPESVRILRESYGLNVLKYAKPEGSFEEVLQTLVDAVTDVRIRSLT